MNLGSRVDCGKLTVESIGLPDQKVSTIIAQAVDAANITLAGADLATTLSGLGSSFTGIQNNRLVTISNEAAQQSGIIHQQAATTTSTQFVNDSGIFSAVGGSLNTDTTSVPFKAHLMSNNSSVTVSDGQNVYTSAGGHKFLESAEGKPAIVDLYKLQLHDYTVNNGATIAEIETLTDGTNGGKLMLATKADNGNLGARMVLFENGNVGIGVEAATSKLHVGGDTNIDGSLSIDSTLTANGGTGTAGQVLTSNGSSPAYWATASTGPTPYYLRVDKSGDQTNLARYVYHDVTNWAYGLSTSSPFTDNSGDFNMTTGYWTCPSTGVYNIFGSVTLRNPGNDANWMYARIMLNNAADFSVETLVPPNTTDLGTHSLQYANIFTLTANDTIHIEIRIDTGFSTSEVREATYFNVHRIE